ncbi:beta-lactamase hydrolase domain-containing protein [Parashewanella tropica]|uniref:beta-lactamase hydrolase domain-containing protein n=1 Tax=Parashewanella tropica TaxID=2547970 RepID=UPI00105A0CB5|nr:sulfur transferase domain-containing protein [Parashewanella tropica]
MIEKETITPIKDPVSFEKPLAPQNEFQRFRVIQTYEHSILPFLPEHKSTVTPYKVDVERLHQLGIQNLKQISDIEFSSGFITAEQLATIKQVGVCSIICLLPDGEIDKNEVAKAAELGLSFHRLPISGVEDITFGNAEKFESLLQIVKGQPFLVHCKSANRNASLITLVAYKYNGNDAEQALVLGKFWGKIRENFEERLRQLMQ